jgi:hypothetical protein
MNSSSGGRPFISSTVAMLAATTAVTSGEHRRTLRRVKTFFCGIIRGVKLASNPDDTKVASRFTVADYNKAHANKDRQAIAEAIRRRFTERYISPVSESKAKHGFTMMAICCLMIEAFESFRQGWKSTDGHDEQAFQLFFARESAFSDFRGYEGYFYRNIRCGILHQGETYNGWKIVRTGPLFDQGTRTINATRFLNTMKKLLDDFCDRLKSAEWKSEDWQNVNKKMRALCKHCRT